PVAYLLPLLCGPRGDAGRHTPSLHGALPISHRDGEAEQQRLGGEQDAPPVEPVGHPTGQAHEHEGRTELQRHRRAHRGRVVVGQDRKSTRLNSSHVKSSYAVFCWKKTSCCPE